jgi:hypothetical protein
MNMFVPTTAMAVLFRAVGIVPSDGNAIHVAGLLARSIIQ